jgi:hypothetical protein
MNDELRRTPHPSSFRLHPFAAWLAAAALAALPLIAQQTTAVLTDSGDNPPVMPVVADAVDDGLTPPLTVAVPNAQAPRLLNVVQPSIAIPYGSRIRQVEAWWNGAPLPLIDPRGTGLAEEAHTFGPMIPFFKPLFSVAGVPAGSGTLEIRAFDATHQPVTSVSIAGLTVVRAPAPIATAAIAAMPHPRIYLTPARLAFMRTRSVKRYDDAVAMFLAALDDIPDVTSPAFEDRVYDTEDYIPLLALTYQLRKTNDAATAQRCAAAAHTLAMRIANDYDSGKRDFGRDTGYDIRFALRDLMLAYDWIYDQFTPAERTQIVSLAARWIDWYHTTPGYAESWPVENYYAGYLQGIALTGVATANDVVLQLLRAKLANEVPIMNQRLAGGDWAEGWNYGPYSITELALVNALLQDLGEDWSADFDWLQHTARSYAFMVAPDFSQTWSYGGYSGNYAHKTSPAMLAVLSSTTADGDYAAAVRASMLANPDNDVTDLPADAFYEEIFARDAATAPQLAPSYFNAGTGRFFSRSGDDFVSTENTSYSYDHYGYANGDVRLYHGTTCLVCPSAYRGDAFDGEAVTPAFSTYLVNGRSQDIVLGRNNQYLFTLERGTYAAVAMRFESSYASSRFDENIVDPANPLDYLIREVVHLRPGTLIVRDLHRRRHATDTLAATFHLGAPLHVSTFYPPGVTVTTADDHDAGGNTIGTAMQLAFAPSTDPLDLVTVFSETLTATSWRNGVLTLSDGTRVTFTTSDVQVDAPTPRRRAAGH